LLALPERSPSQQLTVALEAPGFVLVPTFHVQETLPVDAAVRSGARPAALETAPEAYVTLALHVAPGEVTAISIALAPCLTDAVRLLMRTGRAAIDEALGPPLELGLALTPGVADGPAIGVPGVSGVKAIP
jgi:hypothetical protein